MARVPGIEVDELIAKYELHPHLLDLYVEGEFDRDFVNELFVESLGSVSVSVMTVNEVEMPNERLISLGLPLGSNKYRLVGLAHILAERLGHLPVNVSCLVDADCDRILDKELNVRHLFYTDYTCTEMYGSNENTLRKFFKLNCNLNDHDIDSFMSFALRILPVQIVTRAVNEDLEFNGKVPPFDGGLKNKRDLFSFEKDLYLEKYISINHFSQKAHQIKSRFDELFHRLPDDLRHKAHGHDLVYLLFYFLKMENALKIQGSISDNSEVEGRLLVGAIDSAILHKERLFSLLKRSVLEEVRLWQPV